MKKIFNFIRKHFLLCIGLFLGVASFTSETILHAPTIKEEVVTINSTYKEKPVKLKGTYYDRDGEYAALICPGYSCDRQKWRQFSNLFVKNNISAMTFDYSGQGASYGTIGFDNAKTDNIPVEIDDALTKLHELSGIDYDHIILVGHSMGGRSILRLLYDYNKATSSQTTVSKKDIKNVILFSPEVNYEFNAQASLFAGTSDANEYPWNDYDEDAYKGTNIYLYGSYADDVVSGTDILAIYERLGGSVPTTKKVNKSEVNSNGDKITVGVTNGILHSYIMYSVTFAKFASQALLDITGSSTYNPYLFILNYVGWFTALGAIFLVLFDLNKNSEPLLEDVDMTLESPKKFLLHKLLMWLPGLGIAFLICSLLVVLPWGSPIMNAPYMCFIAGYALTMLLCYRKGHFKGVRGKLSKLSFKVKGDKKTLIITPIIVVLVLLFSWLILFYSMYRLIPFNTRWLYLIFATVLMTIGYYISSAESDMLKKNKASKLVKFLYSLIQYVPLFIFVLFYLFIGSYSGLIGQAQNMVLMYILCIPLGDFVKNKTKNRLYGALVTAFTFQTLMITSAALIAMF